MITMTQEETTPLIAVVTGSRSIKPNSDALYGIEMLLAEYEGRYAPCTLFHGGAVGADTIVSELCSHRGWRTVSFPVTREDWLTKGRSAGIQRNDDMLHIAMHQAKEDKARLVLLSLWDGESPGTRHMMKIAHLNQVEHLALGAPPPPYPLVNHPQLF